MSDTAVAEPVEEKSFVDSFQDFLETSEPTTPPVVEPEPEPEDPKPEPDKPAEAPDPLKEIEKEGDDDEFKLPIDEDLEPESEKKPSGEPDKDNPYDQGTPQYKRFEEMRKESSTLKTELETERQSRTQYEARVKELEAYESRAQELEEKVKEYDARIAVINLQESQAYKELIATPLTSIIEKSDAIADRYEIDKDELAYALETEDATERRSKLKQLTSGLDIDPDDSYELRKLADELQPLKAKRNELLENADKALTELDQKQVKLREAETLKQAEERKSSVNMVSERITSKIPFIKSMAGVDFDAIVERVRELDPASLPEPTKAYNSIAGELLPKFIRAHSQLTRQIEELSDDLATYKKQSPRITPDSGAADTVDDPNDGIIERYKKAFGG